MKLYLLFAGDDYYPGGGIADYQGSYPTEDAARGALPMDTDWKGEQTPQFDWAHVAEVTENGLHEVCAWDRATGKWHPWIGPSA